MQRYIVVGAGILGASTAYHLAKAGAPVTLIDRQDVGQATDAAAGIICPWISQRRNQLWYQLAKGGARYYTTLIKQLQEDGETDTGYKQVGAISLDTEPDKLDKMEERAYKRLADAPEIGEIKRLSPTDTQKLFPLLSDQFGAIHISGAARVNGRALRNSLVNSARKHGAVILQGDATLLYQDKQVLGVEAGGSTWEADKVIITAGAWAKEVLEPLGIHFMVTFQKAQIIHLHVSLADTDSWPVVIPPGDQYILAFEHGRVVVGATHENDTGFDYRVTAGGVHEVLKKALAIAPGLANSTLLETRVGFRPFTPGFLPVLGTIPQYKGLLVANGLGASGLTMGPYLGSQLANIALGKPTDFEISNYSVTGAVGQIM